jgi:hypothetical protein
MTDAFIKKNVDLSLEFDNYLVKHPDAYAKIPNRAFVVITVKGDSKFSKESVSMVAKSNKRKVVEAEKSGSKWNIRPLELTTV